jgi:tRNA pseudouridine38-40 synthase
MTKQRWKLTIEYDGVPYAGWQRQKSGIATVQQAIEAAIYSFCQQDLRLLVAGRTDSGVHAFGQVAHLDLDYGERQLSGFELTKALNAHLREHPITIVAAEPVSFDFHARFKAVNKQYMYRIINRSAPPAIEAGRMWNCKRELDIDVMQKAADQLIGHHDFTSFRDSECQARSPVRTLDRLDVYSFDYDQFGGRDIRIYAESRSFLHHQIRAFAGTLQMAGEGKITPGDVADMLEARDRRVAGPNAPAHGLYLMRVDYSSF